MNRKLGFLELVAATMIALTLCGCAQIIETPPPHVEIITREARVMTHGTTSELQREIIREAVLKMHPTMGRAIQFISVYADDDPHIEWDAAAHCHSGRIICTRDRHIANSIIYHETAHARANQLLESARKAWSKQFAAATKPFDYATLLPNRGLVTIYGSTNAGEDLAEWVECVVSIAEDGHRSPFTAIDKTDPVWMWKLNFLREWEFITQRQYDKIAPLLK